MRSAERGFTLLELLIAVSLMVLLMAVLLGGLHLATHNLGRQSARLDRASRTVLAQNFMRLQLGDARAFTASGSPGGDIAFEGRADGLDFVGPVPEAASTGGLQVLSLALTDTHGAGGLELLLGWRPFTGAASAAVASSYRSVLLDHIQEAAFAYFGSANPDEPPSWHASWHDMTYLPSLVRLSVVFADGERMPEFVAALHMSPGVAGSAAPQ